MTSEKPSNQPSNEANRPSDLTIGNPNHANKQSSSINTEASRSPSAESSPTKSKHKRNRRRNAQAQKKLIANVNSEKQDEATEPVDSTAKAQASPKPASLGHAEQSENRSSEAARGINKTAKTNDASKGKQNATQEADNNHVDLLKEKAKENKELRDQLKMKNHQMHSLNDHIKVQMAKIKELELSLMNATKTCNHLNDLVHHELSNRARLESENEGLNQTISRLKTQVKSQEKQKSHDDEIIRVLNATLIERETEVSILKLKMTRLQTNTSMSSNNRDPNVSPTKEICRQFALPGRSNSEFTRNSYVRSSMVAEAATRSTSSNQHIDKDASIWAAVPEELTPSKRPLLLERSFLNDCESYFGSQPTTPIMRDRRYRTLPKSMKSQTQDYDVKRMVSTDEQSEVSKQASGCLVTNLDDSNNTSHSSGNRTTSEHSNYKSSANADQAYTNQSDDKVVDIRNTTQGFANNSEHKSQDNTANTSAVEPSAIEKASGRKVGSCDFIQNINSNQPAKTPITPSKLSGVKKLFGKFRRTDSTTSNNSQSGSDLKDLEDELSRPEVSPFRRGNQRSTLGPASIRSAANSSKHSSFTTDRPFAEWNTDMLADWLTSIGLSMYANQCRRWVRCGAHIMNATPVEVDKGLGITNPLHRKKLRLAISELNGDCDRITKAAAKMDYIWVARWLDDIGLPQYKDAFTNARVDGRVLNYLTVEDLVSMGIKSLIHHSSIKCGIKVLRSINFDLSLLKRRATAAEREQIDSFNKQINETSDEPSSIVNKYVTSEANFGEDTDVPLWTCHRVMEWLRMIDFAEFAPNLRGSGVHGGLIFFEDGFNADTMCTLLSIPLTRTLLRRHMSTFFDKLIGKDIANRKRVYKESFSNPHLNPLAEFKSPKKSKLWFTMLKSSSKVGQDEMDEYLCPMYPIEPHLIKTPTRKGEGARRDCSSLPKIPESINI